MIGWSNYFGFGFTTLILKRSNILLNFHKGVIVLFCVCVGGGGGVSATQLV